MSAARSAGDVAAAERNALADLFLERGPDEPTLAGDWTTNDLLAHLVVRERRPDAAPGILIPPLSSGPSVSRPRRPTGTSAPTSR